MRAFRSCVAFFVLVLSATALSETLKAQIITRKTPLAGSAKGQGAGTPSTTNPVPPPPEVSEFPPDWPRTQGAGTGVAGGKAKAAPLSLRAVDQTLSVRKTKSQALRLRGSSQHFQEEELRYDLYSLPKHGIITGVAPNLVYTAGENSAREDKFYFRVQDPRGLTVYGTILVNLLPLYDPPVAHPVTAQTSEDTPVAVLLDGRGSDGSDLTFTIQDVPAHGTLSGSLTSLVYTPRQDFAGTDKFTYVVTDGRTTSGAATVVIHVSPVNDVPKALETQLFAGSGQTGLIRFNAVDPDGDQVTATIVRQPSYGTIHRDGQNYYYTAPTDFVGEDTFEFRVNDSAHPSNVATAYVYITDLTRTSDVIVNSEAMIFLNHSEMGGLSFAQIRTLPQHGKLYEVDLFTSQKKAQITKPETRILDLLSRLVYVPDRNFMGKDSFVFHVSGYRFGFIQKTYVITQTMSVTDPSSPTPPPLANMVNNLDSFDRNLKLQSDGGNTVPIAHPLSKTVLEDSSVAIQLSALDTENNPLSYRITQWPQHGTLTGTAPNLNYSPHADFHGSDFFTFVADDGVLTSEAAKVSITVTPVQDTPVAESISGFVLEDTLGQLDIVSNDADGDAMFYTIVTPPANGSAFIRPPIPGFSQLPTFIYIPHADYNGADTAYFTVTDGNSESAPIKISLLVGGVNDPPYLVTPLPDLEGYYGSPFFYPIPQNAFSDLESGSDLSYSVLDLPPGLSYRPDLKAITGVPLETGDFQIEVIASDNENPSYSTVTAQRITIKKAPLSVIVANADKIYGESLPLFTGELSGQLDGDHLGLRFYTEATAESGVGSYSIIPLIDDPANRLQHYDVSTNLGTIMVHPAVLKVSINSIEKNYGQSVPMLSGSLTGLIPGDDISVTFESSAGSTSPVGQYAITPRFNDPDGKLANYVLQIAPGYLHVVPAPIFVRADDLIVGYGSTHDFRALFTGFVNGDTESVISGKPDFSTDEPAGSGVGRYSIHIGPGTLKAANYYFTGFQSGILTITPGQLIVEADHQSRTYGAPNPSFTGRVIGAKAGDNFGILFDTPAGLETSVGAYPILPSLLDPNGRARNYEVQYRNGQLAIMPATIVVAAHNAQRVYGEGNPHLIGDIHGIRNNDLIIATFETAAVENSAVGRYAITGKLEDPSGKLANYTVTFQSGELTILPAPLVVEADQKFRTYGEANPEFTGNIVGARVGDIFGLAFRTPANSFSDVGDYPIIPSLIDVQGRLANYEVQYLNRRLTVTPAPLIVSSDDAKRSYGAADPEFHGTIIGIRNDDLISVVHQTTATLASPVGDYRIFPQLVDAAGKLKNYSVTAKDGVLTVTRATLVIETHHKRRVYGESNPEFSGEISGSLIGDEFELVFDTPATPASSIGFYPIHPLVIDRQGRLANYAIEYREGQLEVTPASLQVVASNSEKVYGSPNPNFAGEIHGLRTGDKLTAVFVSSATAGSPVGQYAIVPELQDPEGKLSNYSVTSQNGILSVLQAPLLVQADDFSRDYGSPNPMFSGRLVGIQNGDNLEVTFTTKADSISSVGNYPIVPVVTGSEEVLSNYRIDLPNGTLSVEPASLLVIVGDASKVYGENNPRFQAEIQGLKNGDVLEVAYSTDANQTSPVGIYPVLAEIAGDLEKISNYHIQTVDGRLTVLPARLAIRADNKTKVYGSPNPEFTVSYSGFVNGDTEGHLDVRPLVNSPAGIRSDAGRYAITVSGAADQNYIIDFSAGELTVTKASLVIQANDAQRPWGAEDPVFGGTVSGVQNDDAIKVRYFSSATRTSKTGFYPIRCEVENVEVLRNYDAVLNEGTLLITQDDPPVIRLVDEIRSYVENAEPLILSPHAAVFDGGSEDFDGGILVVQAADNFSAADSLGLQEGNFSIKDNSIFRDAAKIGSFVTRERMRLEVRLTQQATPTVAQELIRSLTFASESEDPSTLARVIRISLTDGDGGESEPKLIVVTVVPVNDPPVARAGSDQVVLEGSSVLLNGSESSDVDGHIQVYSWSIGKNNAVAQTVFWDNGEHKLVLTVTDEHSAQGEDALTVKVVNVPPSVEPVGDRKVNEGGRVDIRVAFKDPGMDTHTARVDWGDGSMSEGSISLGHILSAHNYSDNGIYQARVIVTDDDGGVGESQFIVEVLNVAPRVNAGEDQEIVAEERVHFAGQFTDLGSADTHTIIWNFGDGSPEITGILNPQHQYYRAGKYNVTLTVIDDDGSAESDALSVKVISAFSLVESAARELHAQSGNSKQTFKALESIQTSIQLQFWLGGTNEMHLDLNQGAKVFDYWHKGVAELAKMQKQGGQNAIGLNAICRSVLDGAMLIAETFYLECERMAADSKFQKQVDKSLAKAMEHLNAAETARNREQWTDALKYYERAWIETRKVALAINFPE